MDNTPATRAIKRLLKMALFGGISAALVVIQQALQTGQAIDWRQLLAIASTAGITAVLAALEKYRQPTRPEGR